MPVPPPAASAPQPTDGAAFAPQQWQPRTPSGAMYYALGFIAFLPVPVLGLLIAAIVMVSTYRSSQRQGGLAAENGRRAANWGLTVIAVMVVVVLWIVVLGLLSDGGPWAAPYAPITLFFALGTTHTVVVIIGIVRANAGGVFNNKLALNLLR
jgi:uncharacterized Tic20 family protein